MKVCPGVARAVTRILLPTSTVCASLIGERSKETSSAAFTWYVAPVRLASASPPVT